MTTCISCVIDRDPRFLTQARLLLASLRSAGVAQSDRETTLVVHVPEEMQADQGLEPLRQLGAVIEPYQPFADGAGVYCNKLVQFQSEVLRQADRVLLLDADILFLRDPRPHFDDRAVRAKVVDFPNPPEEKWRPLFQAAGFPAPPSRRWISARIFSPPPAIAMAGPISCPRPPSRRWPRRGRAGRATAWRRATC